MLAFFIIASLTFFFFSFFFQVITTIEKTQNEIKRMHAVNMHDELWCEIFQEIGKEEEEQAQTTDNKSHPEK